MSFDTDRGTLREFPKIDFPSPKKEGAMKIQFKTDNAAFEDRENETAWILRKLADKIEAGATEGAIMDSNGNTVGHWSF